jgi:outer membrane lipoprotein SlyB
MRALVHLAAGVALLVTSGCAENIDGSTPNIARDVQLLAGSTRGLSPEQRALRAREREYAQSRVTAAVGGALLGALACSALGRDEREVAACAVAGGAAGYVGSTYLTRDHQTFVASRDSLQADINAAREDNARMEANIRVAQDVVAFQRRQIGSINQAYNRGEISGADYTAALNGVAGDIQSIRNMRQKGQERVASMERSIAAYRSAGINPAELERQRAQQRRSVDSLRRAESQLVDVIAATPSSVQRPSV